MKLVREYLNEKFAQDSDPIEDMNIGLGSCILLKPIFLKGSHNPYYTEFHNLIRKGVIIGVRIKNKTMFNIYKELRDLIIPFFQTDTLHDNNEKYIFTDEVYPNRLYFMDHNCTIGRYDINSSNTWNINYNEEIKFAKSVYKGKNNEEWSFYLAKTSYNLHFIISKSGKYVTLVIEGDCPPKLKKYFIKAHKYLDYYLKDGWKKPEEIVELVKSFVNKL